MRRILTCCSAFTLLAMLAIAAAVHAYPSDKPDAPPASAPPPHLAPLSAANVPQHATVPPDNPATPPDFPPPPPPGREVIQPPLPRAPQKPATVDELLTRLEELK